MEDMFEYGTRIKLRFAFKGNLTIEDLWDLSLQDLDQLYSNLDAELKKNEGASLLRTRTKLNTELSMKIELIKYIVSTKLEEDRKRSVARVNKDKKQKLLEALAAKEGEEMSKMTPEDIRKAIAELDSDTE